MSIKVKCPNGHVLKVKDAFAGKIGLCPMCNAKVRVPKPVESISEEDIIHVLGTHAPAAQCTSGTSGIALTSASDSILGASESSLQLGESELLAEGTGSVPDHAMPKKICTKCHREIAAGFHICPFCRTYVANLRDL